MAQKAASAGLFAALSHTRQKKKKKSVHICGRSKVSAHHCRLVRKRKGAPGGGRKGASPASRPWLNFPPVLSPSSDVDQGDFISGSRWSCSEWSDSHVSKLGKL